MKGLMMTLMEEVEKLSIEELKTYLLSRAEIIVEETQGEEWTCDPNDLFPEAVRLAHAVYRVLRECDLLEEEEKKTYCLEEILETEDIQES